MFDTEIVSEFDPRYWGFETQEERDAHEERSAALHRDDDSTVPDFVATRGELIWLAQHWADVALSHPWSLFKSQAPLTNLQWRYAKWRVRDIADLIGEKDVRMAVDEVRDVARKHLGKNCDARTWDSFLNYDDEQTKAFYVEVEKGLYRPTESQDWLAGTAVRGLTLLHPTDVP